MKNKANNYIKSPLNYIGGKYRTLPQLLSFFPQKINTFVDLFAGGLNVGLNVAANRIIFNDHNKYLVEMFTIFSKQSEEDTLAAIKERINKYQLSLVNAGGYNKLRADYNDSRDPIDLFVLTCYAFNHQIRYNKKHEFNTPFGKERSSFNKNIEKNLINFIRALKSKNIDFECQDFNKFNFTRLFSADLVYCDPPYLITTGSYNDGKRGFKNWTKQEERELLALLDGLHLQGIKFALSNVLEHKGVRNELLTSWSSRYKVNFIDIDYSNCNYQFKAKDQKTIEVLITNF